MTDTSLCPLCHLPNLCALEQGKAIDDCWCFGAKLPKQLPAPALSCICPRCAERLGKLDAMAVKELT